MQFAGNLCWGWKMVFTRHHAFWITPRLLSLILENCTFMRGNPHSLWKCLKYVICISSSRTVNLLTHLLHFEKDEHRLWKEILALGCINHSSSSTLVVNPFLCLFILTGNGNVHMWIKNETMNAFFSLSLSPPIFSLMPKKKFSRWDVETAYVMFRYLPWCSEVLGLARSDVKWIKVRKQHLVPSSCQNWGLEVTKNTVLFYRIPVIKT